MRRGGGGKGCRGKVEEEEEAVGLVRQWRIDGRGWWMAIEAAREGGSVECLRKGWSGHGRGREPRGLMAFGSLCIL